MSNSDWYYGVCHRCYIKLENRSKKLCPKCQEVWNKFFNSIQDVSDPFVIYRKLGGKAFD
jgi:hypothetical protein